MNFQTIKPGDRLKGLIPGATIQIITTQPVGDDAIEVYYWKKLAHLFDPHLAVHTSLIEPLPHQITAVYGEMIPIASFSLNLKSSQMIWR